jgi:hypothetical protein
MLHLQATALRTVRQLQGTTARMAHLLHFIEQQTPKSCDTDAGRAGIACSIAPGSCAHWGLWVFLLPRLYHCIASARGITGLHVNPPLPYVPAGGCNELCPVVHVLESAPWVFTLSCVLLLGMPTLFIVSVRGEKAMQRFARELVLFLGLLLTGSFVVSRAGPTVRFVYGMHACVRFLVRFYKGSDLVGGRRMRWFLLRYVGVIGLLCWQVIQGPPVSFVVWPGSSLSPLSLSCAHLSHLMGSIAPYVVLGLIQCVIGFAGFVNIRPADR